MWEKRANTLGVFTRKPLLKHSAMQDWNGWKSNPQPLRNALPTLLLLPRLTAQSRATDLHEQPRALEAAERERRLRRAPQAHPHPSARQEAEQERDPASGHEVHQLPRQAPQRPGRHGRGRNARQGRPRLHPGAGRPPAGDAEPKLKLRELAGRGRQPRELYRGPGLVGGLQTVGEGTAPFQSPPGRKRPAMTELAEGMLCSADLKYVYVVCKRILTYDPFSLRFDTFWCPPWWNTGTEGKVAFCPWICKRKRKRKDGTFSCVPTHISSGTLLVKWKQADIWCQVVILKWLMAFGDKYLIELWPLSSIITILAIATKLMLFGKKSPFCKWFFGIMFGNMANKTIDRQTNRENHSWWKRYKNVYINRDNVMCHLPSRRSFALWLWYSII